MNCITQDIKYTLHVHDILKHSCFIGKVLFQAALEQWSLRSSGPSEISLTFGEEKQN